MSMETLRCLLIVNADDFGMSQGVNQGIIQAHEQGIVTSASLMVRWPAAADAAAYARASHSLSVGLHLDFGEWVYGNGDWPPLYEVVPLDDQDAVGGEMTRQLSLFRGLMGRDPSHLDSHQHVHLGESLLPLMRELAADLGVPLRHQSFVTYCGDFYGQRESGETVTDAIDTDALLRVIRTIGPGFTELACHPGKDRRLATPYRAEREIELQSLCDPRVRAEIRARHIQLCTFDEARRRL